jgi:hypothetical protein
LVYRGLFVPAPDPRSFGSYGAFITYSRLLLRPAGLTGFLDASTEEPWSPSSLNSKFSHLQSISLSRIESRFICLELALLVKITTFGYFSEAL